MSKVRITVTYSAVCDIGSFPYNDVKTILEENKLDASIWELADNDVDIEEVKVEDVVTK